MKFSSIALKNIIRNFRNYLLYLISTVFAVMIFYLFLTLFLNPTFLEMGKTSITLGNVIRSSSIVVAVFSSIFIWYSNNFFIRTRKKEIGIYNLQGMNKRQIGAILFFENLSTGLFSIIAGILLGSLFSRLFYMAFEYFTDSIIKLDFLVSSKAIWITIIVFIFIFFISAVQDYFIIYRFKLIELFRAEKEGEKPPRFSVIIAILSIVLLIACYSAVFILKLGTAIGLMVPITIIVTLATFGFFNSSMPLIIKGLKRSKRFYHKNFMTISLLYYRIKSNALLLATISIITALVLAVMGATYTFYKSNEDINRKIHAYSYMYINGDEEIENSVIQKISEYPEHEIIYKNSIPIIMGQAEIEGVENYGNKNTYLISETKYREILRDNKTYNEAILENNNDCIYLTQSFMGTDEYSHYMQVIYNSGKYNGHFKIIDYGLNISSAKFGSALVIKDAVFNEIFEDYSLVDQNIFTITGIEIKNEKNSRDLTESLYSIIPEEKMFSAFYTDYASGLIRYGPIIFMGIFLSVLFVLATCSIIYFKQLIEANENRDRFNILKKLGVSTLDIRKITYKNIMVVFLLPLMVGLLHSLFALYAFSRLVRYDIKAYILPVFLVYIVSYIIFYIITVVSYNKIINPGLRSIT